MYSPGTRYRTSYLPSAPVCVVRLTPVAACVMFTVAPATTAPVGSVTVPRIPVSSVCAVKQKAPAATKNVAKRRCAPMFLIISSLYFQSVASRDLEVCALRSLLSGCAPVLAYQAVAVRIPRVDGIVHAESCCELRIRPARPLVRGSPCVLQHFLQSLCN